MPDSSSQESGLRRISQKEKSTYPSGGRGKDAAIPKMHFRGDKNPTKSGGINRPTRGYKHS